MPESFRLPALKKRLRRLSLLASCGQKVILSVGGQNGTISVDDAATWAPA